MVKHLINRIVQWISQPSVTYDAVERADRVRCSDGTTEGPKFYGRCGNARYEIGRIDFNRLWRKLTASNPPT